MSGSGDDERKLLKGVQRSAAGDALWSPGVGGSGSLRRGLGGGGDEGTGRPGDFPLLFSFSL